MRRVPLVTEQVGAAQPPSAFSAANSCVQVSPVFRSLGYSLRRGLAASGFSFSGTPWVLRGDSRGVGDGIGEVGETPTALIGRKTMEPQMEGW